MPIALFRLRKLSVATVRWPNYNVHNFSNRFLRDLRMTPRPDGEVVQVHFTRLERQKGLVMHYDESWEFHNGVFRIVHRTLRNGRMIQERSQDVAPLLNAVWNQHGDDKKIWEQFEEEMTARCIIEQYLYRNVPNPEAYRITTFDFNPEVAESGKPFYTTHTVRSEREVAQAAAADRSEDATEWMRLFEANH